MVNFIGKIFGFESLKMQFTGEAVKSLVSGDFDTDFNLYINNKQIRVKCMIGNNYEIFEVSFILIMAESGAKVFLEKFGTGQINQT